MKQKLLPFLAWVKKHINHRRNLVRSIPWSEAFYCIGIFGFAFLAAYLFTPSFVDSIRWTGIILQLFGLLTVVIGLSRVRIALGEKGLRRSVLDWTKSFIKGPENHGVELKGISTPSIKIDALAPTVFAASSLEDRLLQIEKNYHELKSSLESSVKSLKKEIKESTDTVHTESQKSVSEVKELLKNVAIGGITLELSGILYLIFGILFASAPDEFAQLFIFFGGLFPQA